MARKTTKLIIDTNLWISFLISNSFSQLDDILFAKRAKLVFSQELLEEFLQVAQRPKFRSSFSIENTKELLETIQDYAEFVEVKSKIKICRDEKDNFLLSLARDSKADYLITGDKDLLILKEMDRTKILTLTDFLTVIE